MSNDELVRIYQSSPEASAAAARRLADYTGISVTEIKQAIVNTTNNNGLVTTSAQCAIIIAEWLAALRREPFGIVEIGDSYKIGPVATCPPQYIGHMVHVSQMDKVPDDTVAGHA